MRICYDLSLYPITYDVANWLVLVDEFRRSKNLETIDIGAVYGQEYTFRNKTRRDLTFAKERKQWRLENIIIPLMQRTTYARSVMCGYGDERCATTEFALQGQNIIDRPNIFAASQAARDAIHALHPDPYVVITIRQSDMWLERNSNITEWLKVADQIDRDVIFVPDTEALLKGANKLDQFHVKQDRLAALNIDMRLALYEMADFCLFTSGGPSFTAQFDENINYLIVKVHVEDSITAREAYLNKIGLVDGVNRGEYRISRWCDDTFANIWPHVEPFLGLRKTRANQDVWRARELETQMIDGKKVVTGIK